MAGNFLGMGELKILFDRALWVDYGETIAFEDHTLQEYLASCELLRIGGQKLWYDVAVDRDLNEIHPSWFYTLGFVVDQAVNLLESLIDFGRKDIEKVVESEEYSRFLTKVDTSKLSKDQKTRIYKKVFGQYQKELVWIDWDIARRLATFYDDSLSKYLKEFVDGRKLKYGSDTVKHVIRGNVALMVGFLLKEKVLVETDKEWWKERLISYANDDNNVGVLQRHALFGLEGFKDKSIIGKVKKAFNHPSELVRASFINFCQETDPNCEASVRYFIAGTKQESIYARRGLYDITEKNALRQLLKAFSEDGQFLEFFVHQETIFKDRDAEIMAHIDNCYDTVIRKRLIKTIFELVRLFRHDSLLLRNIALLLRKREPDIVDIICKKVLSNKKRKKLLFDFETFLSIVLTKEKVASFIGYFGTGDDMAWILFRILYACRNMQKEEGLAIYQEGRQYLGAIYDKVDKQEKKRGKELSEEEKLYEEFCHKLEPESGKYVGDVFGFFLNNYERIRCFVKDREVDRLKKLASDLLRRMNTQRLSFKILDWDEQNKRIRSFQWSSDIPLFEDCIKVAGKLSISLTPTMRKNIINFIPLAEHQCLESIFGLIGNMEASELTYVIKVYDSDSEKRYFRTTNFVRLIEDKGLKQALPILKSFIDDDKLDNYDRRESLKVKELLQSDAGYLREIFKKYLGLNEVLAEIANGFLIENHSDREAIEWRLSQIKDRKFKFTEPKGVHSVGSQEHELHGKTFAKPLMSLSKESFFERYLDLLEFSLKLLKKDREYWAYSQYIWEIVVKYVDNLKYSGRYDPIKRLEEFVYQNALEEGMNWFKNRLKGLKRNYQDYIGRPRSINDCIKEYNNLKAKQYLDITSSLELCGLIEEVVDKKLRNWIEVEGGRDLFYDSLNKPISETRIQKLVQTKLKAELELIGITTILREPQKLDDERIDFYISYGFSPSFIILIETKKSSHPDLGPRMDMSRKTSFKKVQRYMKGFFADYGILLVFNVNYEVSKWESFVKKINEAYTKIDNLRVIGITAMKSQISSN
jgi:hypothetical protein